MEPNNLCRFLIVYGSYGPGGKNHGIFAEIPGEWKPGRIRKTQMGEGPEDLGPGDTDLVEAWLLKFSDCQAKMFTPEFELQKTRLHERWTALDQAMGEGWARCQSRWWPENEETVVSDKMVVVNIYLPLVNFPHLKKQGEAPHPDELRDINKMWAEVLSGKKKYDESRFIGFLADSHPNDFQELFSTLPKAEEFICRLSEFFRAHQKSEGSLLGNSEEFHLYASPRPCGLPPIYDPVLSRHFPLVRS